MELEQIIDKLNETVEKMDNKELTLEESFKCFSEGMELVKAGNDAIDKVEKKMQTIMDNDEEL